jgi:hypothetical protein
VRGEVYEENGGALCMILNRSARLRACFQRFGPQVSWGPPPLHSK